MPIADRQPLRPLLGSNADSDGQPWGPQPYNLVVKSSDSLYNFWMAQEVLTTFEKETNLVGVTVKTTATEQLSIEFTLQNLEADEIDASSSYIDAPEPKEIKQLVRDTVSPDQYLGHSDTADRKTSVVTSQSTPLVLLDANSTLQIEPRDALERLSNTAALQGETSLLISYCTGCRWLLRAAYYAQGLVQANEGLTVTLVPHRQPVKGGSLVVLLKTADATHVLWDRTESKRFPTLQELVTLVGEKIKSSMQESESEMEDEDAEDARKYFGVM
jgi:selenoprotein W-related protein